MDKQKTIQREVSISGIGLHTAGKVNVTFKPAEADTGIVFIRTDIAAKPQIKASVDSLVSLPGAGRRTAIGRDGATVQTIEHLMAALSGLGIDNIIVEIDAEELPGLDGSSADFLKLLTQAGLKEQERQRQFFLVKEPIFLEDNGAVIIAVPSQEFKISYTLSYNHPMLKSEFLEINVTPEAFKGELASARTFCLEEEAQDLRRQGFGRGANYDNTLVVGRDGVIKNKLRYPNEFIRHKIADLIGDIYLLGQPVKGHFIALRSGHSLNMKLLKKINEQRQRYGIAAIGLNYCPHGEELDIQTIMKILPHREPFLFVDRIVALEHGKRAVGIKNVTINDYFFKGHFPGKPVMPGVLIIEAMAQVGGIMMLASEENRGKLAYFLAADEVKFRKTVVPGDQLVMEVVAGKIKSKTGQVYAKAQVNGKVVAEATLMFALVES